MTKVSEVPAWAKNVKMSECFSVIPDREVDRVKALMRMGTIDADAIDRTMRAVYREANKSYPHLDRPYFRPGGGIQIGVWRKAKMKAKKRLVKKAKKRIPKNRNKLVATTRHKGSIHSSVSKQASTTRTPVAPPSLRARLVEEFRLLVCTANPKYRGLRTKLNKHGRDSGIIIIAVISSAMGSWLGVAAGALSGLVAILLLALATLGKEAFCAAVAGGAIS